MSKYIVAAIIALQVLYLGVTTLVQERHLITGRTVLLETVPVDPRDLLRGDYVILRYKISDVARDLFQPELQEGEVYSGQDIYVQLEKHGEFHEAVAASLWEPEPEEGRLVIRGITQDVDPEDTTRPIRVDYGLEQYFVREGTGNPQGKLTVQVSVMPDGSPLIKEVYVDGVPYAEAMRSE